MEQPAPQQLLQRRAKKLIHAFPDRVPVYTVPTKPIQIFLAEGESPEDFVSRVSTSILGSSEEEGKHEWAAVLALLGWEPVEHDTVDAGLVHCSTCLVQCKLLTQRAHDDSDPPSRKKQRLEAKPMTPISSHRYYCPFVCGFPVEGSSVPMWQVIATKLLRPEVLADDELCTGEDAMMKIHRMLRSGLV